VALTATVMDEVLEQARQAGIDEVMGKPIEVGRLRELLGTLVPG
jgi:CheY-like chemotaxis protein